MILHAVYFPLPADTDQSELRDIMRGLEGLVSEFDGFIGFEHGENIDAEAKSPEAQYGFHCRFTDRAALDRYAEDPRHRDLGARLVALCGGADAVKVYDINTLGLS